MVAFLILFMILAGSYSIIRTGSRNEQLSAESHWSSWADTLVTKYGHEAPELKLTINMMPSALASKYRVEMAPN